MTNREFDTFDHAPRTEAQLEAEKRTKKLTERFSEGGLRVISELLEKVDTMPIASRFDKEAKTEDIERRTGKKEGDEALGLDHQAGKAARAEGEAGLKREQLKRDLERVRHQIISLKEELGRVAMDIEASQVED